MGATVTEVTRAVYSLVASNWQPVQDLHLLLAVQSRAHYSMCYRAVAAALGNDPRLSASKARRQPMLAATDWRAVEDSNLARLVLETCPRPAPDTNWRKVEESNS